MIRDFQIAPTEDEISKYSGYLASSFAFCQFLFAMQWGKMLDRVGRKPVLLCGLFGTSISLLLFGFSTNYYMALFARSLAGVLNGNIAVLRTAIGEICTDKKHQALGFSTLPLLFNFGSVIGPLIGGSRLFTNPKPDSPYQKERIDLASSFGSASALLGFYNVIRDNYPYALSNIIVAMFLWFSCAMGFLFLEETNEKFLKKRDIGLELGDLVTAFLCGGERKVRPWQQKSTADEETPLLENEEARRPSITLAFSSPPITTLPVSDSESIESLSDDFLHSRQNNKAQNSGNSHPADAALLDDEDEVDAIGPYVSKTMSDAIVRRYSQSSGRQPKPQQLTPEVVTVILSNCIISLHSIAYNEFLPVLLAGQFRKSSLHFPFTISGGFGLESSFIGMLFSSTGIIGMLIILVIFPWVDRTLGTLQGFRLSLCFFPLVYTLVPMTIFTLHNYNTVFPSWATPLSLYTLTSLKTLATATGLPQIMILNHRAAAKEHRAYVNSLTMSMLAFARFLGPIVFGYLMTLGDKHHIGWLSWWLMALMALLGFLQSFFMQDYED
ncbi:MFS general substrate transporter [Metschnikowia bicuspidata var. bicuspidata NRRL YB-4993]|uniref:MFS general substrate transporter n=1 Tax=Metschnikowia bicuspidata var. bicuspidata NRRL YB-4993 TaxID=869754 RepID=A0A1A0H5J8_9ASCO|nr:MFS general substrate transporter [Metschnikowia bicuspidata var. bicuspidata NRRL YB-4993]OBA19220.1 MFS general substrate transporter [Metschnikowia bicuspidata var. bicuspidata NRRL YB-4993]